MTNHARCILGTLALLGATPLAAQRPVPPFFQSVAWSPDSRMIAVGAVMESWEDGFRAYIMNADGSGLRQVHTGGTQDFSPAFTPDGKITLGTTLDGVAQIVVLNPDGSGLRVIGRGRGAASWSPDGRRVAFTDLVDSALHLFVMDADGSHRERIVQKPGGEFNPQWSPDGSRILYYSDRGGNGIKDSIYTARPDGSDERLVTNGFYPTWTPDGKRVLLCHPDSGNGGSSLYIVNTDGSQKRRLAEHVFNAAMSPDGKKIAAVVRVAGATPARYVIDVMNADGTGRTTVQPLPAVGARKGYRP